MNLNGMVFARGLGAVLVALTPMLVPAAARAEAQLVGPEFQIAATGNYIMKMAVARGAADGSSIVLWNDVPQVGTAEAYVERYDSGGNAIGAVRAIPNFVPSIWTPFVGNPEVASAADGSFVVAWVQTGVPPQTDYIAAQRFAADGTPVGELINVAPILLPGVPNKKEDDSSNGVLLAMNASGEFALGWTNILQQDLKIIGGINGQIIVANQSSQTFVRLFHADGSAATNAVLVDQLPPVKIIAINSPLVPHGGQHGAAEAAQQAASKSPKANADIGGGLAINALGEIAMVIEPVSGTVGSAIKINRLKQDGSLLGEPSIVSDTGFGSSVGIDDQGNTVTTWSKQSSRSSGKAIGLAGYASDGSLRWSGSVPLTDNANAMVNVEASGDYVVSWALYGSGGVGSQKFAQYYHSDGTTNGAAIAINQDATNDSPGVVTAVDQSGDLTAVWMRYLQMGAGVQQEAVMGRMFTHP
jgi:hypothetical protein